MIPLFLQGGMFMWVLLFLAVVIVVLIIKKTIQLFSGSDLSKGQIESGLNAIIFWGGFSVLLGFYAHFLGMVAAMEAISAANDISPAIVSHGYAVSLITILFGLLILMVSGIAWFVLRWKARQLLVEMKQ